MAIVPELDVSLCNGCGLCLAACHGAAIIWEKDHIKIVESERCDFCGVCEAVCPQYAIRCVYTIILSED